MSVLDRRAASIRRAPRCDSICANLLIGRTHERALLIPFRGLWAHAIVSREGHRLLLPHPMADDVNKVHIDGWFFSEDSQEYDHFKAQIKKECPWKSDDEVGAAILACCQAMVPSEGRARLAACVRQKLGG